MRERRECRMRRKQRKMKPVMLSREGKQDSNQDHDKTTVLRMVVIRAMSRGGQMLQLLEKKITSVFFCL